MSKKDNLLYERKSCYDQWKDAKIKQAYRFSEGYKDFLHIGKTERWCVEEGIKILEKAGFVPLKKLKSSKVLAGKKVYMVNRDKSLVAFVLGKKDVKEGMNMILTHVDSPRIDLKANPLYEDNDLALLKTQYYGGIKKYQWMTIPLALHGVVILKNEKKVTIKIGEKKDDPVFVITDVLPHASRKKMEKPAKEFIEGEELNILVGSVPVKDKKVKNRLKQAIVEHLYKVYGMVEEDFLSAEIEAVPIYEPRDIGFDKSLIGSYGHDDRSCSFAALKALLDIKGIPDKTLLLFWSDKEEIGSVGATGAQSNFLLHAIGKIVKLFDPAATEDIVRDVLHASCALSGDVDTALDPDYKQFHDEKNTALMNYGVVLTKYTGHGGKYHANDADAEYVGKVRQVFNDHNIVWQTGTISKVDEGGGGTIAYLLAALGIHVIDCGAPVLCMHAPFEVMSKADLYATYEAYKVFYAKMV